MRQARQAPPLQPAQLRALPLYRRPALALTQGTLLTGRIVPRRHLVHRIACVFDKAKVERQRHLGSGSVTSITKQASAACLQPRSSGVVCV